MSDEVQGPGAEADPDAKVDGGLVTDADRGLDAAPRQHALSLLVPALRQVVEGALLASGEPLSVERIQGLYEDLERPSREQVLDALQELRQGFEGHGVELVEVAGGWRVQVRASVAPWVGRLWQEKPSRYSRALLETLALIAYRQPITRGEIEQIRGVAVSTPIIKTLTEREWVRVVGHRDVPGRPALFATTRRFLDYFGLRSLNELPPLAEIRDASFFEQVLNEAVDESGLALSNDEALAGEWPAADPAEPADPANPADPASPAESAEPTAETHQRTGDDRDEGR
jgi:segregation and condensation protein B